MTHWGWYWKIKKKHISKKLCSSLPQIDSFILYKGNSKTGFIVEPLGIKAHAQPDHLKITYGKHKEYSYLIPIDKLACQYGGYRYYFRCPLCQKRMRILYLAENSIFICRKCLNLSYETQRLRPTKRYEHMSQKISKHIKDKSGEDLDLYKKPLYMRQDRYQQIKNRIFYYKNKSDQASNHELRLWYGSRIEPYLDKAFDYVDQNKE